MIQAFMTDLERFTETMAKMMGKCYPHDYQTDWAEEECAKCGIPYFNAEFFESVVEGELTPECRKWLEQELPEAWEIYVYETINRSIPIKLVDRINLVLDWRNLWKWMCENVDSWLYKDCTYKTTGCGSCEAIYKDQDRLCGDGKYTRWDVEKWLEGK